MTEQTNVVPKRRFKEFQSTQAWERRKFSELVSRVSTSNEDEGLPRVEFEDIVSGLGQLNKDIFQKESDKKGFEFKPGDTIFGKLRPYLKNWLMPEFKGIAVGDFWVLRPIDTDSKFIYSLIQSSKYQTVANLSTGTKMPRSDWGVVSNTEFEVPFSVEEQTKIGNFFKQLDDTIALHQRKLEKTKALKSAYLSEMFPAEGEREPKRRFAGFTRVWEQCKLGELGSVAMNKRIFKEQTAETGEVPFYKIGTFGGDPDAFISRELFEEYKAKYPYPKVGDILISASGSIGRTVEYTGDDEYFQDSNIVWLKHNERLDNSFLKQFYSIVKWQGLEGSTIKRLYNKNILDTRISVPSLAEQQKIGQFFNQLDNLITLHQRKLQKLQNIKKAYLHEMFV